VSAYADLSFSNVVRVLGSPFDARYVDSLEIGPLLGAAVMVTASALVAHAFLRDRRPEQELVLVLAVICPLGLLAGSIIGKDVLLSRYAVVGVPFMLVVLGAAISNRRRAVGVALLLLAVIAAAIGTAGSHQEDGFYPDTRAAVEHIDDGWRPGDLIVQSTSFGISYTLSYYATRDLPSGAIIATGGDPQVRQATRAGRRLWILTLDTPQSRATVRVPGGYEEVRSETLEGTEPLALTLVGPRRASAGRGSVG